MAESSGYRSDKPSADHDAVAVSEEHPVEFSMWLSQYTYYYDERIKGVVALKVKDEKEVAERVCANCPWQTRRCCLRNVPGLVSVICQALIPSCDSTCALPLLSRCIDADICCLHGEAPFLSVFVEVPDNNVCLPFRFGCTCGALVITFCCQRT